MKKATQVLPANSNFAPLNFNRASRFALTANRQLLWRRTLFFLSLLLMLGTNSFAQGPFYLKAHWDFTNAFSTATDLSGNGNSGYSGTVEVLVSGMDGKRVLQQSFSQKATDTELKINTEHLAPGSYLININAGATGSQQKFIKQ